MKNLSKGQETKAKIVKAARALFYEQGYTETTSRQISESSGTNLGLLNYYFHGKNEIAQIIYTDIRNNCDVLLREAEFSQPKQEYEPVKMFLLSSAIELYLCLENKNYARFYNEIIGEPSIRMNIQNIIAEVLIKYARRQDDPDYIKMASLSISTIKPALVNYCYLSENPIDTEKCIRYYLDQQLHFLGMENTMADELLKIMNNYYLNIVNMFTPVMTKIIS